MFYREEPLPKRLQSFSNMVDVAANMKYFHDYKRKLKTWTNDGNTDIQTAQTNTNIGTIKELKTKVIEQLNDIKLQGIVGIKNIGNTCFINSAPQCLIHTTLLTQFFCNSRKINWYTSELNTNNSVGYNGTLAMGYAKLIYDMIDESYDSSCHKSVTSSALHGNFTDVLSQFSDTQEFMKNVLV